MKWREYYEKLRQWEAEGYDVSELKQKWFPENHRGGRSRARVALSVVVVAIVMVGGLLIWQHFSNGPPDNEIVATLSTSIVPSVGGTVSPSSGTYEVGEEVILTASPASGYQFSHWDGDLGGSQNPITIEVSRDVNVTASFAKVSYSLSASASPSGSGSVTPSSGTYDAGAVVDIVAEAEEGYRFVRWSEDVDNIADVNATSTTITMDDDYSIMASFEEKPPGQYDLTIDSTEGGSVTEPGEGTFTHEEGERVSLTASPASGYRFSHWSGDATGTSATTTVTMDRDGNVIANFEKITYRLTTSVSPSGSGSVTPSSETYDAGTRVTLTASPASGYRFSHWSGDATGTSVTATITMDRDRNVIANFVEIRYTLSVSVGPSGGGSVSGKSGYTSLLEPGIVVYPHARPDSGYTFDYWGGDASGHTNTITITMDSDKHIIANFRKVAPNELYYDDADSMSGSAFSYAGVKRAIKFTPPSYPAALNEARVYLKPLLDHEGQEQAGYHQFAVEVYDDAITGGPGTMLGRVYYTPTHWGWSDIDLSGLAITITDGDFYVVYCQLKGTPEAALLGYDTSPAHNRSWWWGYRDGKWAWRVDTYENYMIRCIVDY